MEVGCLFIKPMELFSYSVKGKKKMASDWLDEEVKDSPVEVILLGKNDEQKSDESEKGFNPCMLRGSNKRKKNRNIGNNKNGGNKNSIPSMLPHPKSKKNPSRKYATGKGTKETGEEFGINQGNFNYSLHEGAYFGNVSKLLE